MSIPLELGYTIANDQPDFGGRAITSTAAGNGLSPQKT
jgi:hypothetical protein